MELFHRPNSPIDSPENFRVLYEQNRLPVFRYVFGLVGGSQDEAEDLTAETFKDRAWSMGAGKTHQLMRKYRLMEEQVIISMQRDPMPVLYIGKTRGKSIY